MERSLRMSHQWNYYVRVTDASQVRILPLPKVTYPPPLAVKPPPTPYQDIHCLLPPSPLPPLLPCSGTDCSDDQQELYGWETSAQRLNRQHHHLSSTTPKYSCNTSRPPGTNEPPTATPPAHIRSKSTTMIRLLHTLRKGRPPNLCKRHSKSPARATPPLIKSPPAPRRGTPSNAVATLGTVMVLEIEFTDTNAKRPATGCSPPHGDSRWNDGNR